MINFGSIQINNNDMPLIANSNLCKLHDIIAYTSDDTIVCFTPKNYDLKCGFDHYNNSTGLFTFEKDGKIFDSKTCNELTQHNLESGSGKQ